MTFEVGGYRAIEMIGAGAFAQVWSGVRVSDDAAVAIKVFAPDQLATAQREAALAAAVNHPHLVAVLDVVADAERAALITELAVGGDLADLLARRGRLTAGETLTVLLPMAAALATAHEREIVHGDLSAENIVFDRAGRPLLADLGAGRAAAELGLPVAATPVDAAPELARGGQPTAETDMFSLGSVAMACLTGRHAWPAEDLRDVLIQAAAGQWPDPGDDAGPPALVAAVRALLEHDPDRRPGAASLAVDLRASGRPEPVDLALDDRDPGSASFVGASPEGQPPPPREPGRHVSPDEGLDDPAAGDPALGRPVPTGRRNRSADGERLVRARAVTRMRADAPPRAEAVAHPRSMMSRLRRPALSQPGQSSQQGQPARSTAALLRIALIAVACVLVAALAGTAGLWWAGWDRHDPVALQSDAPVTSASSSAAASTAVTSTAVTSTGVPSTAITTTGGSPTALNRRAVNGTAVSTVTSSREAPASPVESTSRSTLRPTDWTATVSALDDARAKALIARSVDLLDAVYTRDSAARSADARMIASLLAGHLRVSGARHLVQQARELAGTPIRVVVHDTMPSYPILDAGGKVIGQTTPRAAATRVLVLVSTTDGYRISQVQST